jgi:putative membrane-bound dehydrogenase-like protein
MKLHVPVFVLCGVAMAATSQVLAEDEAAIVIAPKAPPGFSIELVAAPPLVERPIVASFDDEGRLYVAESSGSNDDVEVQLAQRPHRIVRLEDVDGDGKFDRRVVYADKMMLPEGALFLDGSLYVSAPPSIWKLTDRDDDGVAEERVEWFEGKTLTGCANDLHGPYLGLDGWLYWCKGAFAAQTHMVNGKPWTTRAAHIFRRRPEGGELEPVMTGGMDNPVDVAFMPDGERIFSTTYLEGNSRRDGIVHAIYGGVYGKQHGVIDGHPRTGELMPGLVLMNAAAPCGLERYEATAFGEEYRDNLFLCQFNLRQVSRHVVRPSGSSFESEDNAFVTSEHVDFHPTDVITDADGSLLIIDTGGWYKLCCPTSHLWKPDVLGGIYRVRRIDAPPIDDPRGRDIAWATLSVRQLWTLLGDARFAVRQRAGRALVQRRESDEMRTFLRQFAKDAASSSSARPLFSENGDAIDRRSAALARVWMLAQLTGEDVGRLVSAALGDEDEIVRHAAIQIVSLNRDQQAAPRLVEILNDDSASNRRIAAEALGRLGYAAAVDDLLAAAGRTTNDRILQHSIIYALIEIGDAGGTAAGLTSAAPGTVAAALIALDQMPGGKVEPGQVISLLNSPNDALRQTARWLVGRHAEWGSELVGWFRQQLAELPEYERDDAPTTSLTDVELLLDSFVNDPAFQELLATTAADRQSSPAARLASLRAMARSRVTEAPTSWTRALAAVIEEASPDLLLPALEAARRANSGEAPDPTLDAALLGLLESKSLATSCQAEALAALSREASVSDPQFDLLVESLTSEETRRRANAAQSLARVRLTSEQLGRLSSEVARSGLMEVNLLLAAFANVDDRALAERLLASLHGAPVLASVRFDALRTTLAKCGPEILGGIDQLEAEVNVDAGQQRQRIEELLELLPGGDVRRGHVVFHSSKAACTTCHQLGIGGGTVGPDLSDIGKTRTERDLLESILYPSLSFVQSYEPVSIVTAEGKIVSGTVRDETGDHYVLATGATEEVQVRRDDVEEIQPSQVSLMPAGMDKALTTQELADLVRFLKDTTRD